ncbi:MAG: hypothetical protein DME76_05315 [Verrucomicrobia bacterium]|nr:MAG: hypothetical protein DME76_05315 [Verrucomicrobiota bacterium]
MLSLWVARASRVLASASSRSRTFSVASIFSSWRNSYKKIVSARRRNQHAGRVRYPDRKFALVIS